MTDTEIRRQLEILIKLKNDEYRYTQRERLTRFRNGFRKLAEGLRVLLPHGFDFYLETSNLKDTTHDNTNRNN